MGGRYLTRHNTTFIVDYFRNGSGYARAEMDAHFELIERGYDSLTVDGDGGLLALASQATEAGTAG